MKNKLTLVLLILMSVFLVVPITAQEYVIEWNTGADSTAGLITTGKDTSDWFPITYKRAGGLTGYPETLSFLLWAEQGANTDSTNCSFALQLSNDKSYLHNYGTLGTLTASDVSVATVDDKIMTDMALFKYGRVIVTLALPAGDTLTVGAQKTMDFPAY